MDKLLVGGARGFYLLKAQGPEVRKSLCEEECRYSAQIIKKPRVKIRSFLLPEDVAVRKKQSADNGS